MLNDVFGVKAIQDLKDREMSDYVDLLRNFETKKRDFSSNNTIFRISFALRENFQKYENGTLQEKISKLSYGNELEEKSKDKLQVKPMLIKSWFDGPLDRLIQHMKEILRDPKMGKVASILLVGGFGESHYAQEKIILAFPEKRILVPKDAGIVVLKGAVLCGHDLGSDSFNWEKLLEVGAGVGAGVGVVAVAALGALKFLSPK